ncbi:MAG: cobyrinate a,c-diamide synthase, partial [Myxococcota bacterium]|nr:cobyrinate a,c-diamide synthase [Myxococcota bacterium]
TAALEGPGIAIVEGVMGLFDGRSPDSLEGSGAQLAQLLGAPVVLVVDASGMARSAAAVVEGFANHADGVDVRGVVLNRVGSARHTDIIRQALDRARTPHPVTTLGGLPKNHDLFLPSRHLGLMAAHVSEATRTEAARARWRAALSQWATEHIDLDSLLALASTARPPSGGADAPRIPVSRARIGLAMDDAFHFYYLDNLDLLREAGAELVPFSPLADTQLPANLDGLIFGGGYPEEHAAALAENRDFRSAVLEFARSGRPVYGECGGLMYLGDALTDAQGTRHPMVGALPTLTAMEPKLRSLGYREVTTTADSPVGPAGTVFRGHEVHYSGLTDDGGCADVYRWTGRRGSGTGGFLRGRVLGSYIHAHWGSNPSVADAFVSACADARGAGA